jgi:HPt (histidine-containing phosphotransfer) domain-containing protein
MEEKIKNGNVVDLSYVNDLSRGNKQFIKEIITIFLAENPGEIQVIEKAVNENNYEAIKSTAHKLKSTIPFIGLDKIVGNDVAEMEALAAGSSNMEMIKEHLEKLKDACERSYNELGPILNDL